MQVPALTSRSTVISSFTGGGGFSILARRPLRFMAAAVFDGGSIFLSLPPPASAVSAHAHYRGFCTSEKPFSSSDTPPSSSSTPPSSDSKTPSSSSSDTPNPNLGAASPVLACCCSRRKNWEEANNWENWEEANNWKNWRFWVSGRGAFMLIFCSAFFGLLKTAYDHYESTVSKNGFRAANEKLDRLETCVTGIKETLEEGLRPANQKVGLSRELCDSYKANS